jgi:ABC-2 type transport system ATP-binding protein
LDRPVGHKPTLARVGYLPENHRFPRYLTGRQTLEFFAALSGVDRKTRRRKTAELVETVGMSSWADKRVGSYSKGMMQRIGLAQALVNDPELVLLDEPTDGVDPMGRRDVRDLLLGLRERGKTVFLNSHLLSELEMVCDRVAILVGGRVACQGSLDDLTLAQQRYEIEVAVLAGDDSIERVLNGRMKSEFLVDITGNTIRAMTTDPVQIQDLIDGLRGGGLTIKRVQAMRPSLEELFMEAVTNPDMGNSHSVGALSRASGLVFTAETRRRGEKIKSRSEPRDKV